jgi:hypothetical protein
MSGKVDGSGGVSIGGDAAPNLDIFQVKELIEHITIMLKPDYRTILNIGTVSKR